MSASNLTRILEVLRRHRGRENAVSAPNLEVALGLNERTIRRELEAAYDEGVLEELEIPAVGIPGVGFFIATDVDDFQASYDATYRVRQALDRKLTGVLRLARSFGLRLNPNPATNP